MAYIGGTRETQQLLGEVVLTGKDIRDGKKFDDGIVLTTWSIDLHVPEEKYKKALPEHPFISRAIHDRAIDKKIGYPVPYRAFYSRNVPNLFTAGRNISVDREALGTIRVMKTIGMMGVAVGRAAAHLHHRGLPALRRLPQAPEGGEKPLASARRYPLQ